MTDTIRELRELPLIAPDDDSPTRFAPYFAVPENALPALLAIAEAAEKVVELIPLICHMKDGTKTGYYGQVDGEYRGWRIVEEATALGWEVCTGRAGEKDLDALRDALAKLDEGAAS